MWRLLEPFPVIAELIFLAAPLSAREGKEGVTEVTRVPAATKES
jgi:hypothetical protein